MTAKEKTEHERLQRLWATGKLAKKRILRCMELDRQAAAEINRK